MAWRHHLRNSALIKRSLLVLIVSLFALGGGASVSAQAVVDPTSCGHFETWEDAQAALDDPDFPNRENLDPDGDGIACESAFNVGDGDIPADQMACSNFDSQEAAQAHYDASSEGQRNILDPDGDGIACEDAFGGSEPETPEAEETVAQLPVTGTGSTTADPAGTSVPSMLAVLTILLACSAAYRFSSTPRDGQHRLPG